jgi:signal transduction histidine kinase
VLNILHRLWGTRLWRAIVAPALALVLVVATLISLILFAVVRDHDRDQALRQATTLMNLLSYSAESYMLRGSLQRQVTFIGATEGVQSLVVVSGSPARVVASNRIEDLGQPLDLLSDAALGEWLAGRPVGQERQARREAPLHRFDGDSHMMVQGMTLRLQSEAGAPAQPALIGMRLQTDTTGWLSGDLLAVLVPLMLVLLLLGLGLGLYYLRRRIVLPLQTVISHVTAPVAGGGKFQEIPVAYADEIADAVTAINTSFRELEQRRAGQRQLEQRLHTSHIESMQELAYQLHDTVGGYLGGLAFRAHSLATRLQAQQRPEAQDAEEVLASLNEIAGRVRSLSHTLSPTLSDLGGLSTALLRLADLLRDTAKVPVQVQVVEKLPQLEAWQVQHIYLIAQEAVRNIIRHARARRALLALGLHRGRLRLAVYSEGQAWDSHQARDGLGLRAMRYRAELLHADYHLRATRSGRTLMVLHIPTAAQLAALELA